MKVVDLATEDTGGTEGTEGTEEIKSEIRNLKFQIEERRPLEPETWHLKPGTRNPEPFSLRLVSEVGDGSIQRFIDPYNLILLLTGVRIVRIVSKGSPKIA